MATIIRAGRGRAMRLAPPRDIAQRVMPLADITKARRRAKDWIGMDVSFPFIR